MNLRKWFRKRELKRLEAKHPGPAEYPGFSKAQRVALFFTSGKPGNAEIERYQKTFEEEGKEVHLLAFFPYKKKEQAADFPWPNYARNELNWLGKPKSAGLQYFIKQEYDVYIDLNGGKEKSFAFVRAMINAKLCIGFGDDNQPWSDFCLKLDPVQESGKAREEILKYLKFINKSE